MERKGKTVRCNESRLHVAPCDMLYLRRYVGRCRRSMSTIHEPCTTVQPHFTTRHISSPTMVSFHLGMPLSIRQDRAYGLRWKATRPSRHHPFHVSAYHRTDQVQDWRVKQMMEAVQIYFGDILSKVRCKHGICDIVS